MDLHHVVAIFFFAETRFLVPADGEAERHDASNLPNEKTQSLS